MEALDYEGNVRTYLAPLLELNSRVGANEQFRKLLERQMTSDMFRGIFRKFGCIPKWDHALTKDFREAEITGDPAK